jgi:hypothetical protein
LRVALADFKVALADFKVALADLLSRYHNRGCDMQLSGMQHKSS